MSEDTIRRHQAPADHPGLAVNPIARASAKPSRGTSSLLTGVAYAVLGVGLWWLARQHGRPLTPASERFPQTVNLVFEDPQEYVPTAGGGRGGSGTIDPALKSAKEEEQDPISLDSIEQIPTEIPREDRSLMGLVDPQLPVAPGGDGLDAGSGGGKGGGNGTGIGQGNGAGSFFRTAPGGGMALRVKDVARRHQEIPEYPKAAKKLMVEGAVVVRFTINEQGDPINVVIVSGHDLLRECTLEAAWKWRFEPVKFEGRPVQATFEISFGFVIQRT